MHLPIFLLLGLGHLAVTEAVPSCDWIIKLNNLPSKELNFPDDFLSPEDVQILETDVNCTLIIKAPEYGGFHKIILEISSDEINSLEDEQLQIGDRNVAKSTAKQQTTTPDPRLLTITVKDVDNETMNAWDAQNKLQILQEENAQLEQMENMLDEVGSMLGYIGELADKETATTNHHRQRRFITLFNPIRFFADIDTISNASKSLLCHCGKRVNFNLLITHYVQVFTQTLVVAMKPVLAAGIKDEVKEKEKCIKNDTVATESQRVIVVQRITTITEQLIIADVPVPPPPVKPSTLPPFDRNNTVLTTLPHWRTSTAQTSVWSSKNTTASVTSMSTSISTTSETIKETRPATINATTSTIHTATQTTTTIPATTTHSTTYPTTTTQTTPATTTHSTTTPATTTQTTTTPATTTHTTAIPTTTHTTPPENNCTLNECGNDYGNPLPVTNIPLLVIMPLLIPFAVPVESYHPGAEEDCNKKGNAGSSNCDKEVNSCVIGNHQQFLTPNEAFNFASFMFKDGSINPNLMENMSTQFSMFSSWKFPQGLNTQTQENKECNKPSECETNPNFPGIFQNIFNPQNLGNMDSVNNFVPMSQFHPLMTQPQGYMTECGKQQPHSFTDTHPWMFPSPDQ